MRGIIRELGEGRTGTTVIDMEAGLEHLKRGVPSHTDAILVVAEPYFRSLETAQRTAALARDLGIPRVGVVANKVRDEKDEEWIRKVFEPSDLEVVAVVPYDAAVLEADRRPAALIDVDPDAPAVAAVTALADALSAGNDRPSANGDANL